MLDKAIRLDGRLEEGRDLSKTFVLKMYYYFNLILNQTKNDKTVHTENNMRTDLNLK